MTTRVAVVGGGTMGVGIAYVSALAGGAVHVVEPDDRRAEAMQRTVQEAVASAVQRGPLWWAYQHRHHHQHSDEECDVHSPNQRGFWWAHIGWITSARNFPTDYNHVRDLVKFPELVFLNRFDSLVPILLAVVLAMDFDRQ